MILHGDCLALLKTLPANSVHMVVTSPPYWSLRDYNVPPTIWGGDQVCAHVWASAGTKEGYGAKKKWQHSMTNAVATNGRGEPREGDKRARRREDGGWTQIEQGQFCTSCGAWRGCLGLEPTIDGYVAHIVQVFHEVHRVLRLDGTCWLNIGDGYANDTKWGGATSGKHVTALHGQTAIGRQKRTTGLKSKDLCMVPARVALALQADGWYLRSDIVWNKTNPMPESTADRPTKSHEFIYLLAKSERYFYDGEAIRETGTTTRTDSAVNFKRASKEVARRIRQHRVDRAATVNTGSRNRRSVWTFSTKPFKGAHFATFPPKLVEPCILAGTSAYGCCGHCGAGFKRVIELGAPLAAQKAIAGANKDGSYHGTAQKAYAGTGAQDPSATKKRILDGMRERLTVGWTPTCRCGGPRVRTATSQRLTRAWYRQRWQARIDARWGGLHGLRRPVVLDPFGGAGTTALVAEQLGRDSLLIELGEQNVRMTEARIGLPSAEASA